MAKPLATAANRFDWYCITKDSEGKHDSSHDGSSTKTDHWLSAETFNRLKGGTLQQLMGIRSYTTEAGAMAALWDVE